MVEMEGSVDPTAPAAQQAAIQEVRARYERGHLSFEAFRRALDALLLARNADECEVILRELPASPSATLAALETTDLAPPDVAPQPRHKWIAAFMGQTQKMRRPWRLAPRTHVYAFMGDVKLDLNLAELPTQAQVQVVAVMGSVTLYVPRGTHVSVRSAVVLGDTNAMSESISGVVAFGHEEHTASQVPSSAHLQVDVFAMMASVKVALTDGPTVSIRELLRDVVQSAADGVRRGLAQGASHSSALDTPGARSAERPRAIGPADTRYGDTPAH